jgi:hypothetical protein
MAQGRKEERKKERERKKQGGAGEVDEVDGWGTRIITFVLQRLFL